MDFGVKKGLERGHYVAQMGIVSNLLNKTEPTANACDRGWHGETLDSIQIFRQGLNGFIRNTKSSEIHTSAGKAKLVRVDESCQVTIIVSEGNTMVSVPSITDSLTCPLGYTSG